MFVRAIIRYTVVFLLLFMPAIFHGQNGSTVLGKTQDCFAGKLIHPAHVDIYLFDSAKSPEITTALDDLEQQKPKGENPPTDAFFAQYNRLASAVSRTNALGHVRSGNAGDFLFQSLTPGKKVLVFGISEREDDPAYYAYRLLDLRAGTNSLILDFDSGNACTRRPRTIK